MLPQLPLAAPIVAVGNRKAGFAGGDLRAGAHAQFAQFAQRVINLDMIRRVEVSRVKMVGEVRPVDIVRIERVDPQRGFPADETGLVGHAIAYGCQVIGGFNAVGWNEETRAVHARVTPPIPRVAAGIEMAGVVAADCRSLAKHIRLHRQRSRLQAIDLATEYAGEIIDLPWHRVRLWIFPAACNAGWWRGCSTSATGASHADCYPG